MVILEGEGRKREELAEIWATLISVILAEQWNDNSPLPHVMMNQIVGGFLINCDPKHTQSPSHTHKSTWRNVWGYWRGTHSALKRFITSVVVNVGMANSKNFSLNRLWAGGGLLLHHLACFVFMTQLWSHSCPKNLSSLISLWWRWWWRDSQFHWCIAKT